MLPTRVWLDDDWYVIRMVSGHSSLPCDPRHPDIISYYHWSLLISYHNAKQSESNKYSFLQFVVTNGSFIPIFLYSNISSSQYRYSKFNEIYQSCVDNIISHFEWKYIHYPTMFPAFFLQIFQLISFLKGPILN